MATQSIWMPTPDYTVGSTPVVAQTPTNPIWLPSIPDIQATSTPSSGSMGGILMLIALVAAIVLVMEYLMHRR